jgi:hypothetical protein
MKLTSVFDTKTIVLFGIESYDYYVLNKYDTLFFFKKKVPRKNTPV